MASRKLFEVDSTVPMTAWGLCTSIDLFKCDPLKIRDADCIKHYVVELCKLIDMKRFGNCQVVHFGQDKKVEGFSMVQLIETSLISGHFANESNNAYIDVFSCKFYNPADAIAFSKRYFCAQDFLFSINERKSSNLGKESQNECIS